MELLSLVGEKKMNPFLAACAAMVTWRYCKKFGKGLIAEDIVKTGIAGAFKRLKNGNNY